MDQVGVVIHVGGVPTDVDNNAMTVNMYPVDWPTIPSPPNIYSAIFSRPAIRQMIGVYQITFLASDTGIPGHYRIDWVFTLNSVPQVISTFIEVGPTQPAYDNLPLEMKQIVEDVWAKFCVDDQTEALTKRGWKYWYEIKEDDELLVLDHISGLSKWQPILKMNIMEVEDEPMLSMETMVHSSLTTLWHKWPVHHTKRLTTSHIKDEISLICPECGTQEGKRGPFKSARQIIAHRRMAHQIIEGRKPRSATSKIVDYERAWKLSRELNSNDCLITGAPCIDLPTNPKWSDDFVELAAWYWTEGNFKEPRIGTQLANFSQSEVVYPENVVRIRKCLFNIFGESRYSDRLRKLSIPSYREANHSQDSGVKVWYLNAAASRELLGVIQGSNKIISWDFLLQLTQSQLNLFIDCSIRADGWITKNNSTQISQADKERLESFDLACILAGQTPRSRKTNCFYKGEPRDKWNTTIRYKNTMWVPCKSRSGITKEIVSYSGIIWCPTTESHTWLARRNGTVYFTGNCDGFDSPYGGPNLQIWFQSKFGRGRIAQLLRQTIQHLNTVGQPIDTYTVDGVNGPEFPVTGMNNWSGLLNTSLTIEVYKQLMRAYVEDPDIQGDVKARLTRRDYLQRWGQMLEIEREEYKDALDNFKITQMFAGSPRVLVSGGVYGNFGPTRLAGNAAARPRYWSRWY